MKILENKAAFENLLKQEKPVMLDFYADWCGPCKALLPVVEKLSKEYEGKVEIRKVNVDENRELAAEFRVQSIPSLFFIKDAKVVDQLKGLVPASQLKTKLNALLN